MKKMLAQEVIIYYALNTITKKSRFVFQLSACFLFFISLAANQNLSYAESKSQIAEQYRLEGYENQKRGNFQEALSFYYKAVHIDPTNAVALNDIGVLYEHFGYDDKAEAHYLKAIDSDAAYLPPYTNLGYLYLRQQNLIKAIEYFKMRSAKGHPNDPWTQKAEEEMYRAYNRSPYLNQLMIEESTRKLELSLSQKQLSEDIIKAQQFYQEGLDFFKKRQYQSALIRLNAALNYTPDNPDIIKVRNRAMLEFKRDRINRQIDQTADFLERGQSAIAEKEFRKIMNIIPDDPSEVQAREY